MKKNEFVSLSEITTKLKNIDIISADNYKRLLYDDVMKSGGANLSSGNWYIPLSKGISISKIVSYTELTDNFKVACWDDTLKSVIIIYSSPLTLDKQEDGVYTYSLSNGDCYIDKDDCYYIPNKGCKYKGASGILSHKLALYSDITKGNEKLYGYILLTYDLLFLSIDNGSEEVDTIKINDRFFGEKEYVAFGDSITSDSGGAETDGLAYPNLIGKYFGFITKNVGSSGSIPHNKGTNWNLNDTNLAKVTSETMLVTISGGTNGWVTATDINSTDRSTSVGAFNYAIDYIRNISPKCVIILCPMYAGSGNFKEDYVKIAENKGVGIAPVLDNNLINWRDDVKDSSSPLYHILLRDGTHPTNYGAFRLAALIKEYIKNFII